MPVVFPGHHLHPIHARKIGESPWGWRDGILTAVSTVGTVEVKYALEPGGETAWHHVDLTRELAVGTPVRACWCDVTYDWATASDVLAAGDDSPG